MYFPSFNHFFLAFRFWKHIAGTMVISSRLRSFKFLFAGLRFAEQARLFYSSNWFILLPAACHLQAAWILPQETVLRIDLLSPSKARSEFAKTRWSLPETATSADISNPFHFFCLFCITPGLCLNTGKILRLYPRAAIWPFPRGDLPGSHKSFPWQRPAS